MPALQQQHKSYLTMAVIHILYLLGSRIEKFLFNICHIFWDLSHFSLLISLFNIQIFLVTNARQRLFKQSLHTYLQYS